MHICFITPEFVTEPIGFDGGLANYLYRVSLSLIKLGHTPTILVISDKNEIFRYQSIEIHRVEIKKEFTPHSWIHQSYLLNEYLAGIHRSDPFDIIQYTSFTATGLFRLDSAPCIVRISSIHNLLASNYELPKDDTNYLLEEMELCSLKNADGVFGPSRIIADEVTRYSGLDVTVIESPYLSGIVKKDDRIYKDHLCDKQYLLFFGTIGILKGVAIIAEILNELLVRHPHLYFVFVGKDVGYGDIPMMQYVYEISGDVKDRIVRFDKMHHDQLYPVIENAYAVVLPSRIDNFPNTCIEAMAHGKMVVGTDNTGFNQLITDKVNGFLCEKDNSANLLNVIEFMMSLPIEEKLKIEENAKIRIDLLKPEIVVNELLDYYSAVITRFREGKVFKRNDADHLLAKTYFSTLEHLITENQNTIKRQEEVIKMLYQSYAYNIGIFILKPVYFIRRLIHRFFSKSI